MPLLPQLELSAARVADALLTFPTKHISYGRDYLHAERLTRPIRPSDTTIAAQLHGYQDDYIPHCAQMPTGLQVDCTCGSSRLCAHVTALLIDFSVRPTHYQPLPYRVRRRFQSPWDWLIGIPFPWHEIPEMPPIWRMPCDDSAWPQVQKMFDQAPHRSFSHDSVVEMLADTHPSWVEFPPWRENFSRWLSRSVTRYGLAHWLDLLNTNPHLPLESVWDSLARGREDLLSTIMVEFRPIDQPQDLLRTRSLLYLLTQALGNTAMSTRMWNAFRGCDPHGACQGDALLAVGSIQEAIAIWESLLPDSNPDRARQRQKIIAIAPPATKLEHLIAACWESPSQQCIEHLKSQIPHEAWQALSAALNSRRATLGGE